MTNLARGTRSVSLLEELDARQDELLHRLDELNRRLEATLAEFSAAQKAQAASERFPS